VSGLGPKHPAVQHLRRLSGRRRARSDAGAFVIDGPVLVAEALDAGVALEAVYAEPAEDGTVAPDVAFVAARAVDGGAARHDVAPGVLAKAVDPVTPHGIAAIATLPASRTDLSSVLPAPTSGHADDGGGAGPILVLAGIADPGNAGTLLRSAEAAGAMAVVATTGTVDLFAPKVVRASAGSLFRLPVAVEIDGGLLVEALRSIGIAPLGTAADAPCTYDRFDLTAPIALFLGNEAHGLEPSLGNLLADAVAIPMAGHVESLNVAMAGTLVLFEAARQRRDASR
jgi:TrmH family RNA methyltransferase